MTTQRTLSLSALYDQDETAWLEAMADLAARGAVHEMDYPHLSEYLADMARRDKREVFSRLVILMSHLLKWAYQSDMRSRSWDLTIREQREELEELLRSQTLRNYAQQDLDKAYHKAARRAAVEAEMEQAAFPEDCPWDLEHLLNEGE